jgi:hypothetical protein
MHTIARLRIHFGSSVGWSSLPVFVQSSFVLTRIINSLLLRNVQSGSYGSGAFDPGCRYSEAGLLSQEGIAS